MAGSLEETGEVSIQQCQEEGWVSCVQIDVVNDSSDKKMINDKCGARINGDLTVDGLLAIHLDGWRETLQRGNLVKIYYLRWQCRGGGRKTFELHIAL
jgi:hypothetical protein